MRCRDGVGSALFFASPFREPSFMLFSLSLGCHGSVLFLLPALNILSSLLFGFLALIRCSDTPSCAYLIVLCFFLFFFSFFLFFFFFFFF
jgi:sterol desaturase/sphingolipid hydroxylase (fatty acid hydroxylase superfamily)